MHPSETGHRISPLEEHCITDLRSFRAIVAILREKYPTIWGIHITHDALEKLWNEAPIHLTYYAREMGYGLKLDGIKLAHVEGNYIWPHTALIALGHQP